MIPLIPHHTMPASPCHHEMALNSARAQPASLPGSKQASRQGQMLLQAQNCAARRDWQQYQARRHAMLYKQ